MIEVKVEDYTLLVFGAVYIHHKAMSLLITLALFNELYRTLNRSMWRL